MAEITVIVPVYRAEAFLHQCVDSILSQSFSDFRLILVDDGSPDRCGEICDGYAGRDSRVTVLHQQNQGQSAARNRALDETDSPWVCFVDSDDLIHPQLLEKLHRAAVETGTELSMCRMLEAPEPPEGFFASGEGKISAVTLDDETLARMYDEGTYPAWVCWGKLTRRELVEQYRFAPGRVYEDNEAVCHWAAGRRLAQVEDKLYFYRTNPDSTTQSSFSEKKLDFLWALDSIAAFYGSIGFEETYERFLDRFILESADYYRRVKNVENRPDLARRIQKNCRRLLRREGRPLTKRQREALLDAMHPRLIRLYWPAEGAVRTLRDHGLGGLWRKVRDRFGRGEGQ